VLPPENLHAVPASVDDETAVFVEPTAAACRVVEQVRIEPGTRAAVVGAGRLGLLVAQVLRAHGASVVVIARGRLGHSTAATLGFETMTTDSSSSLARQFPLAVDATGNPAGFASAARLVRPRGTLVVKSTFHGETPVDFSPLVVDEITIVGSRCGPFPRALELLAAGQVQVKPLVSGVFPLEQFVDAFDCSRRGLKAIFRVN
jgi:threonine dehydrogenase-like Zn-dependent dehydrogenase